MRGKAPEWINQRLQSRITPAYAGKRLLSDCVDEAPRDHPCVCGEKLNDNILHPQHDGSPLRMRGKALRNALRSPCNRITPAYAGKSAETDPIVIEPKDHPCVCGEKFFKCHLRPLHTGSPLRMRGKGNI